MLSYITQLLKMFRIWKKISLQQSFYAIDWQNSLDIDINCFVSLDKAIKCFWSWDIDIYCCGSFEIDISCFGSLDIDINCFGSLVTDIIFFWTMDKVINFLEVWI